ncbi:MAG: hypothetical protein E7Z69_06510 [Thermoplasmata archaeon]|nr:hypothetical protein [Thermoplasmata archaeon]
MESSSKKAFGGIGIIAALLFIVSGLMVVVAGKPFDDDDCKTAMYIFAAAGALAIVYAIGLVLEKRSMVLTVSGVFLAIAGLIAICIPFIETNGVAPFCAFGIFALFATVSNVLSDWADQVKGAMYVNSLLAAVILFAVIMTYVKGDYFYEVLVLVAMGIWLVIAAYIGAFISVASGTKTRVVVEDAVSQKKADKPKAKNSKATKKAKKPEQKKEEPAKAEEPAKTEPAKEEPKPTPEPEKKEEPAKTEPAKAEPAKEEPKKEMTKDESMKDFMSKLVASKDASNASKRVEEKPAEEPAKIEPAEEPAKIEPAEEQPKLEPAEEPAKIEPAEEPAKIEPAEEPAKIEPAEEQPKLEPAEEPAKIEPAEESVAAAAVAAGAVAAAIEDDDLDEDDGEPEEDIYTDNSPEALVRRAAWNKGLRCRRDYGEYHVPVAFVKGKVAVYVTDDPVPADTRAKLEEDGWTVIVYRASDITDGLEQGDEIAAQVKANIRAAKAAKKKKAKKRSFPIRGANPLLFPYMARTVRACVKYRQSLG